MKQTSSHFRIGHRVLLSTLALLPAFLPWAAMAQQSPPAAFSFAVVGDTRPMMYLPSKDGQPELTKLFVEIFGLVMPPKLAEEVVKRDVKMIFDPVTKELVKAVMPFNSKTEVMTLTMEKGWVTEASVEDAKLLPGVHRTMFRLHGGDWVAREIVKDVKSGRAKFVVDRPYPLKSALPKKRSACAKQPDYFHLAPSGRLHCGRPVKLRSAHA